MKQATTTTTVVPMTSFLPGQLTFFISTHTSRKKSRVVGHHSRIGFILFPLARSYGRGGGIRTPNLRFWRPPLYQLELHPSCRRHTFPSLCGVCLRQKRQYFASSSFSVVVFLFFVEV